MSEHGFLSPNPVLFQLDSLKKRPGLAHELGAGAPCSNCKDKCPGFQLHFWRKVCMNCRCGKAEHNVIEEADPGFYFVGRLFDRPLRTKEEELHFVYGDVFDQVHDKAKAGKAIKLDWVPPGVTADIASKYLRSLPQEYLSIQGSEGAQRRKKQLEKQFPIHDVEPTNCHELSTLEIDSMKSYVESVRQNVAGQGLVQELVPRRNSAQTRPFAAGGVQAEYIQAWRQEEEDQYQNLPPLPSTFPPPLPSSQPPPLPSSLPPLPGKDILEVEGSLERLELHGNGGLEPTLVSGTFHAKPYMPGYLGSSPGTGYKPSHDGSSSSYSGLSGSKPGFGGSSLGKMSGSTGSSIASSTPSPPKTSPTPGQGGRQTPYLDQFTSPTQALKAGSVSSHPLHPGYSGAYPSSVSSLNIPPARTGLKDPPGRQLDNSPGRGSDGHQSSSWSCSGCGEGMLPGEVAIFAERAGKDKCWHPSCFTCCSCGDLLEDLLYFYSKGKLFCGRDFATMMDIPRCSACDELIFAAEYTGAEERFWHLKHFCCYECDTPLAGHKYIPVDSQPYCLTCWQNSHGKICLSCQAYIHPEDQRVTLASDHWHATEQCFHCGVCRMSLLGGKLTRKDGVLLCSSLCAAKLTEQARNFETSSPAETIRTAPAETNRTTTVGTNRTTTVETNRTTTVGTNRTTPVETIRTTPQVPQPGPKPFNPHQQGLDRKPGLPPWQPLLHASKHQQQHQIQQQQQQMHQQQQQTSHVHSGLGHERYRGDRGYIDGFIGPKGGHTLQGGYGALQGGGNINSDSSSDSPYRGDVKIERHVQFAEESSNKGRHSKESYYSEDDLSGGLHLPPYHARDGSYSTIV